MQIIQTQLHNVLWTWFKNQIEHRKINIYTSRNFNVTFIIELWAKCPDGLLVKFSAFHTELPGSNPTWELFLSKHSKTESQIILSMLLNYMYTVFLCDLRLKMTRLLEQVVTVNMVQLI